ncbi:MAG: ubiquinone biosynthesis regulatory protein kinase UbiB [Halomonadaceae bacterium]|nr:MAG: ubiquinone biosynthesis regulatory protein kinase UbiB [Halomonadaceae bacterium]
MTRLQRLFRISWVIGKYRLDDFLKPLALPLGLRLLLWLTPWRLFPRPKADRGLRLRLALEELGPVFVKFGQILSTRRDLLPEDMADALQQLQDRVPAFDSTLSRTIIEQDLEAPVGTCFARFDPEPLASASVAQVHSARLHNGMEVVVKVIRPGIERVIRQDIALMYLMAGLLQRFWEEGPRLRPVAVVADYERTIFDELDLQREAANGSQLRRNFPDSPLIYIPEIHWPLTRRRVLVMERVYGIPVADTAALHAAGVDMKVLAERGVEIFFTQVFRDSFFHADMHPGNIFVDATDPADPRYIAIDFGIIGTLTPSDQSYLARNLLAFFNRDYRQVAQLHIQSGWVPEDTRVDEFESAIRTVCEPIFERPLKDISFGLFLLRLFETARRFRMEVQPQLVLLQKTLLNVEGLGRQLYPDLDLWQTAHPYLEQWMQKRIGPVGLLANLRQQLPDWLEQAPEMPQLLHDALFRLSDSQAPAPRSAPPVTKQPRWWRLGLASVCILAAVIWAEPALQQWFGQWPTASWILLGAAGAVLLPALLRRPTNP